MKKSKKILKEARKLIAAGWIQYASEKFVHGKPHYCLSYAISKSAYLGGKKYWSGDELEAREAVVKVIEKKHPGKFVSLIGYNDDIAKDKRYVLRVLDRAIASL